MVGGNWLVLHGGSGGWQLDRNLSDSELSLIPLLCKVIAVENLAVTTVDLDGCAAADVFWHVVLFSTERHAWAVREDWVLGQLLSLQELREGSAATVLCVDLFNFDGVIAEEEVQGVEFVTAVVANILPEDLKAEDTSIIVQETLEAAVRTSTLQFDLNIILEFSLIGRNLLHINHRSGELEWVFWVILSLANILAFVRKVRTSELITVYNAEDTVIDVEVHAQREIRPIVIP